MLAENSRSNSSNWVLVKAVRILLELLDIEPGDLGGGVGVLFRDSDSFEVDSSAKKIARD